MPEDFIERLGLDRIGDSIWAAGDPRVEDRRRAREVEERIEARRRRSLEDQPLGVPNGFVDFRVIQPEAPFQTSWLHDETRFGISVWLACVVFISVFLAVTIPALFFVNHPGDAANLGASVATGTLGTIGGYHYWVYLRDRTNHRRDLTDAVAWVLRDALRVVGDGHPEARRAAVAMLRRQPFPPPTDGAALEVLLKGQRLARHVDVAAACEYLIAHSTYSHRVAIVGTIREMARDGERAAPGVEMIVEDFALRLGVELAFSESGEQVIPGERDREVFRRARVAYTTVQLMSLVVASDRQHYRDERHLARLVAEDHFEDSLRLTDVRRAWATGRDRGREGSALAETALRLKQFATLEEQAEAIALCRRVAARIAVSEDEERALARVQEILA